MTLDPTIAVALRVGFALLFFSAAVSKLDAARFRAVLEAYRLLPASLSGVTARLLLALELSLALGWALAALAALAASMPGLPQELPQELSYGLLQELPQLTALATVLLLALYTAAIVINLWRGRRQIDCGCGFARSGQQLSWGLVLRNLVLMIIAFSGSLNLMARSLGLFDYFIVLLAVFVGAFLFAALNQLLVNHNEMAIWRTGSTEARL
ncbi:MAG: MauE/DoxX family redox-associated membrane protein [Pseudohongiellaceae bacterium]